MCKGPHRFQTHLRMIVRHPRRQKTHRIGQPLARLLPSNAARKFDGLLHAAIPGEFPHSTMSTLLFKSLSQSELQPSLLPFYLGLDFDGRRRRFDGAVSDEAIRAHCAGLDLACDVVLACLAGLAIFPCSWLPDYKPGEIPSDQPPRK